MKVKSVSVVKHPAIEPWKDAFRAFSLKVGFNLHLTKSMLEMLCAIADNVVWDRGLYWKSSPAPENWIATEMALEKRGLIVRRPRSENGPYFDEKRPRGEWSLSVLTPAGKAVVEVLKVAGLFIEQDAAINKRTRRA